MNNRPHVRRHPASSITSVTAIAVGVGICLGALAFLIPNRNQLVAGDGASDQSAVITALTAETLQLCRDNEWSQKSVDVLNNFLRSTGDLQPINAEVLRQSESIPPKPRVLILGTLVHRALGNGDVALAEAMQLQLLDAADTLPVNPRELDAAYHSGGTAGNAADGYFEGRIGLDFDL